MVSCTYRGFTACLSPTYPFCFLSGASRWGYYSLLNRDKEDFHQWRFFDARKCSGADVTILVCLIPPLVNYKTTGPNVDTEEVYYEGVGENKFVPTLSLPYSQKSTQKFNIALFISI